MTSPHETPHIYKGTFRGVVHSLKCSLTKLNVVNGRHSKCLSLPSCGQLGSSNHTALFILSYTKDLSLISYTFIIELSVCTYDSALSLLVICVQCYIGPCGVLVPTGMVHSNNEFEFEFECIAIAMVLGRGTR